MKKPDSLLEVILISSSDDRSLLTVLEKSPSVILVLGGLSVLKGCLKDASL